MTSFLRVPNDDARDNAHWDLVEGGHSFWSYVDSTPGGDYPYYPHDEHTDDCFNGIGNPECPEWLHVRGEKQCIAANSKGRRCGEWVISKTPFCRRHLGKAWEALYTLALESERELLARDVEWDRRDALEHRAALAKALRLETALLLDAAGAAAVLPERVYFFAACHAVKIGRSVNPERRVKTLKGTKCPADVDPHGGVLLGTIPGGHRVESELHTRFRAHRLDGEWFELAPISDEIAALIAEAPERAA